MVYEKLPATNLSIHFRFQSTLMYCLVPHAKKRYIHFPLQQNLMDTASSRKTAEEPGRIPSYKSLQFRKELRTFVLKIICSY